MYVTPCVLLYLLSTIINSDLNFYFYTVGKMEKYDNKWIMNANVTDCDSNTSSPATLGLTNMAGEFSGR